MTVTDNPYTREFTMADGRKILIDKRFIGHVCEDRERPTGCVVAFRGMAKPVPITACYEDVSGWASEFTASPAGRREAPRPAARVLRDVRTVR